MAGLALWLFAGSVWAGAEVIFPPVEKSSLGPPGEIFEVKADRAEIGFRSVQRIDFKNSRATVTVRDEDGWPKSLFVSVEVFDRYGLKLGGFDADFTHERHPHIADYRERECEFYAANLAPIFAHCTVKLPADWAELRFVHVTVFGIERGQPISGGGSPPPQIDPTHPHPRPMVVKQQQVRPAIFEENKFGTSNVGPVAFDAKWSNYGAYFQRMLESIQLEWDRILTESAGHPTSGGMATVKFRIDKQGKISEIVGVQGTAGSQWEKICTGAITRPAPYGDWTDDMIAMLGESQEMTFTFHYQ